MLRSIDRDIDVYVDWPTEGLVPRERERERDKKKEKLFHVPSTFFPLKWYPHCPRLPPKKDFHKPYAVTYHYHTFPTPLPRTYIRTRLPLLLFQRRGFYRKKIAFHIYIFVHSELHYNIFCERLHKYIPDLTKESDSSDTPYIYTT